MYQPRQSAIGDFREYDFKALDEDEEMSVLKSGYMFLMYAAEASGLYDGRDDFHQTFTVEDEGRVVFLYVFLVCFMFVLCHFCSFLTIVLGLHSQSDSLKPCPMESLYSEFTGWI